MAGSAAQPRIIIHIGSRKTATTYIQQALGMNEELLAAAGVYQPENGRFDLNPGNIAYHNLTFETNGDPRFRPEGGGWDDVRNEIARNQPETVLMSCEDFDYLITHERVGDKLLAEFKTLADRVTVVLVVRDWTEYINSMYNQNVKLFAVTYPFDRYIKTNLDAEATKLTKLYRPFIEDEAIEFVVLPYPSIQQPDPATGLLRALDIEVDEQEFVVPDGLINTSLGAIGLEVTTMLSKYLDATYDDWYWQSPAAQHLHIDNLVALDKRGWNAERFWGWTPELMERFVPQIKADLDEFGEAVWNHPWPSEIYTKRPLLESNFEHYPPDLLDGALNHIDEMQQRYEELRQG